MLQGLINSEDYSACVLQVRALLQARHEVMAEGLECLHAFFAQDGPEVLVEWDRYLHQVWPPHLCDSLTLHCRT